MRDVRMTMKYTHIGLEDQARALAALPAPGSSFERLHMAALQAASGVTHRHRLTRTIRESRLPETKKPLRVKGFRRRLSQTVRSSQLA